MNTKQKYIKKVTESLNKTVWKMSLKSSLLSEKKKD